MNRLEEIQEQVGKILYDVYDAGRTKSAGANPYHWFDEEKDIFTKQIINCFAPQNQALVDGKWVAAKQEPYYPLGIEWLKCTFGFHELVQSKKYAHTKYCFRCGKRKQNNKFDY